MFPIPEKIRVTVRGVQHQVELPVSISVSWQRPPLAWATARSAASAFFSERLPAGTTPPPPSSQASPIASFSSFAPTPISPSPFIKPDPVASLIVSVVPTHLPLSFQLLL